MPSQRVFRLVLAFCALLVVISVPALLAPWFGWGSTPGEEVELVVPRGASLAAVADDLHDAGLIESPRHFRGLARLLGTERPVQAGRYRLQAGLPWHDYLEALQQGRVIRQTLTIPEGTPSVLVAERLMAMPGLVGPVAAPAEGSVLPQTYDYGDGETRAAVLARMQAAMTATLDELWPRRTPQAAVKNREEAVTLASIVEKETGKAAERRTIAGVYSNRLRLGMKLDADPTVIYPITKGKPLGRRIRRSELDADTGYNTYVRAGLPEGPIANPGRASIEAVLDPAPTEALYFVADGSGGHVFANTLAEHNANVQHWYAVRRSRGEM
ncbi:endolytic transglycosylase MltG [Polymorphobacter sp.]|uniref:endolytic transglycosylase MltG n=1 Tax=Polymorphobacter sp. TaxID=1909290 RepID=UPI003F725A00